MPIYARIVDGDASVRAPCVPIVEAGRTVLYCRPGIPPDGGASPLPDEPEVDVPRLPIGECIFDNVFTQDDSVEYISKLISPSVVSHLRLRRSVTLLLLGEARTGKTGTLSVLTPALFEALKSCISAAEAAEADRKAAEGFTGAEAGAPLPASVFSAGECLFSAGSTETSADGVRRQAAAPPAGGGVAFPKLHEGSVLVMGQAGELLPLMDAPRPYTAGLFGTGQFAPSRAQTSLSSSKRAASRKTKLPTIAAASVMLPPLRQRARRGGTPRGQARPDRPSQGGESLEGRQLPFNDFGLTWPPKAAVAAPNTEEDEAADGKDSPPSVCGRGVADQVDGREGVGEEEIEEGRRPAVAKPSGPSVVAPGRRGYQSVLQFNGETTVIHGCGEGLLSGLQNAGSDIVIEFWSLIPQMRKASAAVVVVDGGTRGHPIGARGPAMGVLMNAGPNGEASEGSICMFLRDLKGHHLVATAAAYDDVFDGEWHCLTVRFQGQRNRVELTVDGKGVAVAMAKLEAPALLGKHWQAPVLYVGAMPSVYPQPSPLDDEELDAINSLLRTTGPMVSPEGVEGAGSCRASAEEEGHVAVAEVETTTPGVGGAVVDVSRAEVEAAVSGVALERFLRGELAEVRIAYGGLLGTPAAYLPLDERNASEVVDRVSKTKAVIGSGQWRMVEFPPTALRFDGESTFINCGAPQGLAESLEAFQLDFTMKTSTTTGVMVPFGVEDSLGKHMMIAVVLNGTQKFEPQPRTTTFVVKDLAGRMLVAHTQSDMMDGKWYQISWRVVSASKGKVELRIDGTRTQLEVIRSEEPSTFQPLKEFLCIGALNAHGRGQRHHFKGFLRDVAFTPLPHLQLDSRATYTVSEQPRLVCWPMDEGVGSAIVSDVASGTPCHGIVWTGGQRTARWFTVPGLTSLQSYQPASLSGHSLAFDNNRTALAVVGVTGFPSARAAGHMDEVIVDGLTGRVHAAQKRSPPHPSGNPGEPFLTVPDSCFHDITHSNVVSVCAQGLAGLQRAPLSHTLVILKVGDAELSVFDFVGETVDGRSVFNRAQLQWSGTMRSFSENDRRAACVNKSTRAAMAALSVYGYTPALHRKRYGAKVAASGSLLAALVRTSFFGGGRGGTPSAVHAVVHAPDSVNEDVAAATVLRASAVADASRADAAVLLQKWWRGHLGRRIAAARASIRTEQRKRRVAIETARKMPGGLCEPKRKRHALLVVCGEFRDSRIAPLPLATATALLAAADLRSLGYRVTLLAHLPNTGHHALHAAHPWPQWLIEMGGGRGKDEALAVPPPQVAPLNLSTLAAAMRSLRPTEETTLVWVMGRGLVEAQYDGPSALARFEMRESNARLLLEDAEAATAAAVYEWFDHWRTALDTHAKKVQRAMEMAAEKAAAAPRRGGGRKKNAAPPAPDIPPCVVEDVEYDELVVIPPPRPPTLSQRVPFHALENRHKASDSSDVASTTADPVAADVLRDMLGVEPVECAGSVPDAHFFLPSTPLEAPVGTAVSLQWLRKQVLCDSVVVGHHSALVVDLAPVVEPAGAAVAAHHKGFALFEGAGRQYVHGIPPSTSQLLLSYYVRLGLYGCGSAIGRRPKDNPARNPPPYKGATSPSPMAHPLASASIPVAVAVSATLDTPHDDSAEAQRQARVAKDRARREREALMVLPEPLVTYLCRRMEKCNYANVESDTTGSYVGHVALAEQVVLFRSDRAARKENPTGGREAPKVSVLLHGQVPTSALEGTDFPQWQECVTRLMTTALRQDFGKLIEVRPVVFSGVGTLHFAAAEHGEFDLPAVAALADEGSDAVALGASLDLLSDGQQLDYAVVAAAESFALRVRPRVVAAGGAYPPPADAQSLPRPDVDTAFEALSCLASRVTAAAAQDAEALRAHAVEMARLAERHKMNVLSGLPSTAPEATPPPTVVHAVVGGHPLVLERPMSVDVQVRFMAPAGVCDRILKKVALTRSLGPFDALSGRELLPIEVAVIDNNEKVAADLHRKRLEEDQSIRLERLNAIRKIDQRKTDLSILLKDAVALIEAKKPFEAAALSKFCGAAYVPLMGVMSKYLLESVKVSATRDSLLRAGLGRCVASLIDGTVAALNAVSLPVAALVDAPLSLNAPVPSIPDPLVDGIPSAEDLAELSTSLTQLLAALYLPSTPVSKSSRVRTEPDDTYTEAAEAATSLATVPPSVVCDPIVIAALGLAKVPQKVMKAVPLLLQRGFLVDAVVALDSVGRGCAFPLAKVEAAEQARAALGQLVERLCAPFIAPLCEDGIPIMLSGSASWAGSLSGCEVSCLPQLVAAAAQLCATVPADAIATCSALHALTLAAVWTLAHDLPEEVEPDSPPACAIEGLRSCMVIDKGFVSAMCRAVRVSRQELFVPVPVLRWLVEVAKPGVLGEAVGGTVPPRSQVSECLAAIESAFLRPNAAMVYASDEEALSSIVPLVQKVCSTAQVPADPEGVSAIRMLRCVQLLAKSESPLVVARRVELSVVANGAASAWAAVPSVVTQASSTGGDVVSLRLLEK